jgi:methyl-accepting chemotaxis protein
MGDAPPAAAVFGIKVRFGGLRARIVALLLSGLLVLLVAISLLAARALREALVSEFTSKGEAIALSLSNAAEGYIVEGRDASTIQGFVDRFRYISGVGYVFVIDQEGFVLSHTFHPEFPQGLERAHPFPGAVTQERFTDVAKTELPEQGQHLDVVVPIQQGRLGEVHVGMKMADIQAHVSRAVWSMLGVAVLVFAGAAAGSLLVVRQLVNPVRRLTMIAQRIVEQGDLTQEVVVTSSDEIGVLAQAFGALLHKLRTIPATLRAAMAQLTEVVNSIGAMTDEQSATLSQQAAALQETGVVAKEIQETSALAAAKAASVTEVAARVQNIGQAGQRSLEETLAGLDEIQRHVQRVVDRSAELSERTGQVAEITEAVKDLADQSKVLALNAAIEATKAGEHGKGFAVVAREIRALATQSIESTMRVREILGEVEGAIRGSVESSREGRERVRGSVEQVRTGGEKIRQLASAVDESAAAAKQIAAAVAQQSAGISQIFSALLDLNRMMTASVQALGRTSQASKDLSRVSSSVSDLVNSFRV